MAHSAHKDEYYITEHLEADAVLDKHTDELLKLWKESKHIVVFTGAGISTSAGIPDFRGPQGVWTLAAAGKLRTGPTTPGTPFLLLCSSNNPNSTQSDAHTNSHESCRTTKSK
jgi:hypothetical protein